MDEIQKTLLQQVAGIHEVPTGAYSLRIDGKLAAFTLGEQIDEEIAVIHIEKADSNIPGLYTIINQQFVEHAWTHVKYINREEDMGLEGLRQAKEGYCPERMVHKFNLALE